MARKKAAKEKPPPAAMLDFQLVHVAAKLGLADLLKAGPKSPAELARSTGTHPRRGLRLLECRQGRGRGRVARPPARRHPRGEPEAQGRALRPSARPGAGPESALRGRQGDRRSDRVGSGDFFESVPKGANAYIMKYILHDWDDDVCVKILENCRRGMAPNGRVLVVDTVIPSGNDPHWGKLLGINMLVGTGGRERTRSEFAQLFARAGLKLKRVIPTACPLSIVEGVAA